MATSKTAAKGITIILVIIASLVAAIALGLYAPPPDSRGGAELSGVVVGPFYWDGVPLSRVIDDVNAQISKTAPCHSRLFMGSDLAHLSHAKVSFMLDSLPAEECARYIAESTSLRIYSVPEGIIIDTLHQDHRSWQRRYCDWVRHTFLQRWFGRLYSRSNPKDVQHPTLFA